MSFSEQTFDPAAGALALDGVQYALLRGDEKLWRVASLNPAWREELALLSLPFDREALATRNTWLAPDTDAPPMAVMCCGLGSAYPGMGRDLYDNFPAARAAMDEIAAIAAWDALSLMDEPDPEKINRIRWQIPYLFMLEYAQWSQLRSLGFAPSLVCGHSLGELVALCLAGVYSVKVAWFLMDIHAAMLADLEESSRNAAAMLAIPADISVISDILRQYPALAIANRNTPRQFILAGPRDDLAKVRKSLRRNRVPAMFLNMGIAFHTPQMRVLRALSQRRLNALEMRAPHTPLLSCVTARRYPATQADICSQIMDLEENAVIWPDVIDAARGQYGINHFLELGPHETLCGLVQENAPDASCIASGRKSNETLAMRQTCARLFAMGALKYSSIARVRNSRPAATPETARETEPVARPAEILSRVAPEDLRILMGLLSEISGKPVEELRPELDLRYDLALRSSNFPMLIQEAEKRLDRSIPLENLFQIATVGDLILFLSGKSGAEIPKESFPGASAHTYPGLPPLLRFAPLPRSTGMEAEYLPRNVCGKGISLGKGDLMVILAAEDTPPELFLSLAPTGCIFAVPQPLFEKFALTRKAGAGLMPMRCPAMPDPRELAAALAALPGKNPAGIMIIPPVENDNPSSFPDLITACASQPWPAEKGPAPWILVLGIFTQPPSTDSQAPDQDSLARAASFFEPIGNIRSTHGASIRAIAWLKAPNWPIERAADMLALELRRSSRPDILWRQWEAADGKYPPLYCPVADCCLPVYPDNAPPLPPRSGRFDGLFQISRYQDADLDSHGANALWHPHLDTENFPGEPWQPLSNILKTMLAATRFTQPGLRVSGFIDLRFFAFPVLPAGITREGRIDSRSVPWMPHDRVMARVIQHELSIRAISANGRRGSQWLPLAAGACLSGGRAGHVPPLWAHDQDGENWLSTGADTLRIFYEALGMGAPWRVLGDFRLNENFPQGASQKCRADKCACQATIAIPGSFIANGENWNYKDILYLIDGAFHGCLAALALGRPEPPTAERIAASMAPWRFCGIGFIRFDPEKTRKAGNYRLRLGPSWLDEREARFDIQIHDAAGQMMLTMDNVGFRCEPVDGHAEAEKPAPDRRQ